MNIKKHAKAPLPFQGQKRNWITTIRKLDFSGCLVVDVFGGSGLLAHTIKEAHPDAVVVWNDYDNYQKRLDNFHIVLDQMAELREIIAGFGIKRNEKMTLTQKNKIVEYLNKQHYIDLSAMTSFLLFSGRTPKDYKALINAGFYNNLPKTAPSADGYLVGVGRVQMDYKELIEQYKNYDNVVFLLDPPYLSTTHDLYVGNSFDLRATKDMLQGVKNNKFVLFSSDKSDIDVLIELIYSEEEQREIKKVGRYSTVNMDRGYEDQMFLRGVKAND